MPQVRTVPIASPLARYLLREVSNIISKIPTLLPLGVLLHCLTYKLWFPNLDLNSEGWLFLTAAIQLALCCFICTPIAPGCERLQNDILYATIALIPPQPVEETAEKCRQEQCREIPSTNICFSMLAVSAWLTLVFLVKYNSIKSGISTDNFIRGCCMWWNLFSSRPSRHSYIFFILKCRLSKASMLARMRCPPPSKLYICS